MIISGTTVNARLQQRALVTKYMKIINLKSPGVLINGLLAALIGVRIDSFSMDSMRIKIRMNSQIVPFTKNAFAKKNKNKVPVVKFQ